jgi:hypothetical protein
MVGAGNGSGLVLYGATDGALGWLADLVENASAAAGLAYDVLRADPWDVSDHACYYYAGAPALFATTIGEHAGYHTPADGIDHIRVDDLAAAAGMMWATLVPLALGTEADFAAKRGGPAAAAPLGPVPDLDRERRIRR